MENRYVELFRLEQNTYYENCPMVLEAGVLLKDNARAKLLAQLKLKNLSEKTVVACTVEIQTFTIDGSPLQSVVYQYKDFSINNGATWGEKKPVFLPDKNTRRIQVLIREVVFEPLEVWHLEEETPLTLPNNTSLQTLLESDRHIREYASRVGENALYIPEQKHGLFLCTCGRINWQEDSDCGQCGRNYEFLSGELDVDSIRAVVAEQMRLEEEARIAAEKAAEEARLAKEQARAEAAQARRERWEAKKPKVIKRVKIFSSLAIVLAALTLLSVKVIIPAVKDANEYKAAATLYDAGRYSDARTAFEAMGDYKDASTRALECTYQIALDLYESGDFESAISTWDSLGSYSDSKARSEQALTDWKKEDYQNALALKQNTDYIAAAEAFALLGDYKDSEEQHTNCLALQQEVDYNTAVEVAESGDHLKAMELFSAIGDYRDAADQYKAAAYRQGAMLFDTEEYEEAFNYFTLADDYEDAQDRAAESRYQFGCQLLKNGEYTKAVEILDLCGDYNDAAKKALDARFRYVKDNLVQSNKTTQAYLKTLIDANYTGAKALQTELYAWKVELIGFNNNPYSASNQTSLSKYQTMCAHFRLTGGEPGKTVNLRTVLTLPSGASGTINHPGVKAGYEGVSYCWYDYPAYSPGGALQFKVYDESGKLLLSTSVSVSG